MPSRASLNVSLTPEFTAYIAGQVASGRYRSASEVVRASLRLLQRAEPAGATPPPPAAAVGTGDGPRCRGRRRPR
jgi:antitoxin ParD1/3/4